MPKVYEVKKNSRFYISCNHDILIMFAPIKGKTSFISTYKGYFELNAQYTDDIPYKDVVKNASAIILWDKDTKNYEKLEKESEDTFTVQNFKK